MLCLNPGEVKVLERTAWKAYLENGQSAITERHKLLEVHHVELSDEDDLSNRLGKYQSALGQYCRTWHSQAVSRQRPLPRVVENAAR